MPRDERVHPRSGLVRHRRALHAAPRRGPCPGLGHAARKGSASPRALLQWRHPEAIPQCSAPCTVPRLLPSDLGSPCAARAPPGESEACERSAFLLAAHHSGDVEEGAGQPKKKARPSWSGIAVESANLVFTPSSTPPLDRDTHAPQKPPRNSSLT
jgi:hypothetical protein